MLISDIRKRPTTVTDIPDRCVGVHESCLRAYQILQKVKYLFAEGVPLKIVLELVKEMETPLERD